MSTDNTNPVRTDGLARKLFERWAEQCARWAQEVLEWDTLSDRERANWEAIAALARVEMMRNIANGYEALLKMTNGDPESAPYRAGIRFVADALRKGATGPN